jgi:hypothetical protein
MAFWSSKKEPEQKPAEKRDPMKRMHDMRDAHAVMHMVDKWWNGVVEGTFEKALKENAFEAFFRSLEAVRIQSGEYEKDKNTDIFCKQYWNKFTPEQQLMLITWYCKAAYKKK